MKALPVNSILINKSHISKNCICCGGAELERHPAVMMPFISHMAFGHKQCEITPSWGLRSLPIGLACAVSNSLECADCGLIFLDVRFDEDAMGNLYTDYRGDRYTRIREQYEPGYLDKNKLLNKGFTYLDQVENFLSPYLPSKKKILDWGGDTGKNTPFRCGDNIIHVYDVSDKKVIEGVKKIDRENIKQMSYDLIVLSNVLEHVPYPAEILLDIRESMNKETILYIELPYENLIKEKKNASHKKHWHEHINFFTKTSLEKLIQNTGLRLREFKILDAESQGSFNSQYQLACSL